MEKRISLIDADSLIYIVSWNHKDSEPYLVKQACNSFVQDILLKTNATHYLGSFSSSKNFRHAVYKVAPYKGTRPAKPEWVTKWEDCIKEYLSTEWHFINPPDLEADDIVGYLALKYPGISTICSPDKDMKQIEALHYDYKNPENGVIQVSKEQATYNFWLQMLTGDITDNLKGVPGLGIVKASKLLKGLDTDLDMHMAVLEAYIVYYGEYYGTKIYNQTLNCIQLIQPYHAFFQQNQQYLETLVLYPVPTEESYPEI